jgi:hypothetical protein
VEPLQPSLDADVISFVMTGVIPPGSKSFQPVFTALSNSSAGSFIDDLRLPSCYSDGNLLVTADFARTVCLPTAASLSDAYQRPVQWIISARIPNYTVHSDPETHILVILSPWEANELLPALRTSAAVTTLHLFAPRTSLSMRSAEDMMLYTTPSLPPTWLAPRTSLLLLLLLFSGQLYLRSYAHYVEICRILQLPHLLRDYHDDDKISPAANTNLAFFNRLLWHIRHDCTDISRTDLGRILTDHLMTPDAFDSPSRAR